MTQPYTNSHSGYSLLGIVAALFFATGRVNTTAAEPVADELAPSQGEKLFALHVRPIFQEKCSGCHSKEEIKGGFDLSSRKSMLEGGDAYGESVVVPGDIDASSLLVMIARDEPGYEMPPKEADRLSQQEVWAIRDWIRADAPWPNEKRVAEIYDHFAEGITVTTSGGLHEEWTNRKYKPEDLWAFQPLRRDFTEILRNQDQSPIDQFIDHQLDALGIDAAPPADRRSLIRRVTFNLIGLPPTPEEVQQFLDDPRSLEEAFATVVDRLLESPHYGEQWARHWLDVARYADSSGFANDHERPNAWRYRDYVIRAFNNDKPYDQFIREQIAGDEVDSDNAELLVATGFLRMGPWEHTGMSVAKVTRQQWLDDITDTVGQVFLGQALQCCRCHDHKFDPIPTRDYYSMQAVFATTQFAEIETEWLDSENLGGMDEDQHYHRLRNDRNDQVLEQLEETKRRYVEEWFAERDLPFKTREEAKKANVPDENLPPGRLLRTPNEFGQERVARKWNSRFTWEFDRYKPIAFTVYNGKTRKPKNTQGRTSKPEDPMRMGTLEQTAILNGGDVFSPGEVVKPGVLSVVPGGLDFKIPNGVEGRRKALADWLIDPQNPITPRVITNRIWAFHFGRGIAGNPNNFGATGKKPTHPALLDWLATEFKQRGWSFKELHRLILNTRAYRRAAQHEDAAKLATIDPNRESYASFLPRRLEAEEIRDASLWITGELNREMGGIPIRPDMNLEAALQPRMIMGTFAPSYFPNPKPKDRNRRSIYTHRTRGQRLPFMETFNQPGSEKSCELRDQSNITPQVFALLNGHEANDRALALAARILKETDRNEDAIKRLFQLLYGRPPTAEEAADSLGHWRAMTRRQEAIRPRPREFPRQVIREAVEENTGKPFTFSEQLFVYDDYQPDLQPHEVDARTRGLGDTCLSLMNSNEFMYLY